MKYNVKEWIDWIEIDMPAFAEHVQGKRVLGQVIGHLPKGWKAVSGIALSDGSAVISASQWSGPYSRETPDIDAEPPRYYLASKRAQ